MANTNTTISINKTGATFAQIKRRSHKEYGETPSAIANRELGRYYDLLRIGRRVLRKNFSDGELNAIADTMNGTFIEGWMISAGTIALEMSDAVELNGVDAKWEIDGAGLVLKIQEIDGATLFALIDAVQCFWMTPNEFQGLRAAIETLDKTEKS